MKLAILLGCILVVSCTKNETHQRKIINSFFKDLNTELIYNINIKDVHADPSYYYPHNVYIHFQTDAMNVANVINELKLSQKQDVDLE